MHFCSCMNIFKCCLLHTLCLFKIISGFTFKSQFEMQFGHYTPQIRRFCWITIQWNFTEYVWLFVNHCNHFGNWIKMHFFINLKYWIETTFCKKIDIKDQRFIIKLLHHFYGCPKLSLFPKSPFTPLGLRVMSGERL